MRFLFTCYLFLTITIHASTSIVPTGVASLRDDVTAVLKASWLTLPSDVSPPSNETHDDNVTMTSEMEQLVEVLSEASPDTRQCTTPLLATRHFNATSHVMSPHSSPHLSGFYYIFVLLASTVQERRFQHLLFDAIVTKAMDEHWPRLHAASKLEGMFVATEGGLTRVYPPE